VAVRPKHATSDEQRALKGDASRSSTESVSSVGACSAATIVNCESSEPPLCREELRKSLGSVLARAGMVYDAMTDGK
jgi:hypothetical protein